MYRGIGISVAENPNPHHIDDTEIIFTANEVTKIIHSENILMVFLNVK